MPAYSFFALHECPLLGMPHCPQLYTFLVGCREPGGCELVAAGVWGAGDALVAGIPLRALLVMCCSNPLL